SSCRSLSGAGEPRKRRGSRRPGDSDATQASSAAPSAAQPKSAPAPTSQRRTASGASVLLSRRATAADAVSAASGHWRRRRAVDRLGKAKVLPNQSQALQRLAPHG